MAAVWEVSVVEEPMYNTSHSREKVNVFLLPLVEDLSILPVAPTEWAARKMGPAVECAVGNRKSRPRKYVRSFRNFTKWQGLSQSDRDNR